MNKPLSPAPPRVSFSCPPDLAARIDAWIAAQPEPRPSQEEAISHLLAAALADVSAEPGAAPAYQATRIGSDGTVDEWRGAAPDDEVAAHRLGQHLKTRLDQEASGYTPDDTITLIRPDGEIVTMAPIKEMIERLTGWKTAASADPALEGEWGS